MNPVHVLHLPMLRLRAVPMFRAVILLTACCHSSARGLSADTSRGCTSQFSSQAASQLFSIQATFCPLPLAQEQLDSSTSITPSPDWSQIGHSARLPDWARQIGARLVSTTIETACLSTMLCMLSSFILRAFYFERGAGNA